MGLRLARRQLYEPNIENGPKIAPFVLLTGRTHPGVGGLSQYPMAHTLMGSYSFPIILGISTVLTTQEPGLQVFAHGRAAHFHVTLVAGLEPSALACLDGLVPGPMLLVVPWLRVKEPRALP